MINDKGDSDCLCYGYREWPWPPELCPEEVELRAALVILGSLSARRGGFWYWTSSKCAG